jgi:hypothetical protein
LKEETNKNRETANGKREKSHVPGYKTSGQQGKEFKTQEPRTQN